MIGGWRGGWRGWVDKVGVDSVDCEGVIIGRVNRTC